MVIWLLASWSETVAIKYSDSPFSRGLGGLPEAMSVGITPSVPLGKGEVCFWLCTELFMALSTGRGVALVGERS